MQLQLSGRPVRMCQVRSVVYQSLIQHDHDIKSLLSLKRTCGAEQERVVFPAIGRQQVVVDRWCRDGCSCVLCTHVHYGLVLPPLSLLFFFSNLFVVPGCRYGLQTIGRSDDTGSCSIRYVLPPTGCSGWPFIPNPSQQRRHKQWTPTSNYLACYHLYISACHQL